MGWVKDKSKKELKYTWDTEQTKVYSFCSPEDWLSALNSEDEDIVAVEHAPHALTALVKAVYLDKEEEPTTVEPGVYRYNSSMYAPNSIEKISLRNDLILSTSYFDLLVKDLDFFIENEQIYRDNEVFYKRGYLLYGKPGDGKSSTIRKILREKFEDSALLVYTDCIPDDDFISLVNQDERFKIFVFEDFQNSLNGSNIQKVLDFLDGQRSVDKMIVIATTNYPEQIPGNILDRPSRFDYLIEFKDPDQEDLVKLFKKFSGKDLSESDTKLLQGFSIAALKEVSLMTAIQKISVKQAVKALRDRSATVTKSFRKDDPKDFIL